MGKEPILCRSALFETAMNELTVRPSGALRGSIFVSGSKNAALPILIAALLADTPSVIGNLPAIRDVQLTLRILQNMGCVIEPLDAATYRIDPRHANAPFAPDLLTGKLRASTYLLGAYLGRFGRGCIGHIGGCDFGGRPIDQHIKALSAMGATVIEEEDGYHISASSLQGASVKFDVVSVGATVNAILAAVRAKGETCLENAAAEPHIDDLIVYLNRCGADIRRIAPNTVVVRGVERLCGCRHTVIPDMIEAGTYLIAGAATRGAVRVRGISPTHLLPLTQKLEEMGADVDCEEDSVSVFVPTRLYGAYLETAPHPGFPTDLQPQMVALMSTALGYSRVCETIWQHRFRYTEELIRMGAKITVKDHIAEVRGTCLSGATLTVPDLRAGAALLIAACAAEGESRLQGIEFIERGYENFVRKLRSIGADIRPA